MSVSGGAFQMPAGRIRIQVAADEAELGHAALQLGDRSSSGVHAGRLRQLAHADEVLRIEPADAVDQIVAVLGPVQAGRLVADVMRPCAEARGEKIVTSRAALALKLQLRALEALPDLVVGDRGRCPWSRRRRRILQARRSARRDRPAAPCWRRRVVTS